MDHINITLPEGKISIVALGDFKFTVQIGETGYLCFSIDKPGDDEKTRDIDVTPDLDVTVA